MIGFPNIGFGSAGYQHAANGSRALPVRGFIGSNLRPLSGAIRTRANGPRGNATGVNVLATDLEGKRLELLGELASASAPVAVLINPKAEYAEQQAKDLQEGAHRIGRQILILNASSERDIDNAFRTLIARQAG